jgi:2,3-dihydroxyphenylpropionate 1,2-dioxygenase
VPAIEGAPPEIRERLTDGRNPATEARRQREARVLEVGRLAAAGEGPCLPLNQAWDRDFLDRLRQGDLLALDTLTADGVRAVAGRGGNEVLCWVAAFAALSAAGSYHLDNMFYEAIPGWIAGMAMVTAASMTKQETTP